MRDRPRSARHAAVLILVVALIITTGGWIGSLFVSTPAELAAKAAPPPPSLITATVQKRVVEDAVITRGTVTPPSEVNGLANRTVVGAKITVVTRMPFRPGDTVQPGQVAVELSGRPVIALPGAFPAYRDLAKGSEGPDVTQLQSALTSLKLSVGRDKKGTYGDGTAAAVGRLYKNLGYHSQSNAPMAELLYLTSFPARISSSTAEIGSDASTATLNFSTGALTVYVTSDAELHQIAKTGGKVELSSEILGKSAEGTVSGQIDASSTDATVSGGSSGSTQTGQSQSQMIAVAPDVALGAEWAGQDVRVKFINGATSGAVLAVPISAIYSNADGQRVVSVRSKGTTVQVVVRTGVVGGGYAEIVSAKPSLAVGQLVVIGSQ